MNDFQTLSNYRRNWILAPPARGSSGPGRDRADVRQIRRRWPQFALKSGGKCRATASRRAQIAKQLGRPSIHIGFGQQVDLLPQLQVERVGHDVRQRAEIDILVQQLRDRGLRLGGGGNTERNAVKSRVESCSAWAANFRGK